MYFYHDEKKTLIFPTKTKTRDLCNFLFTTAASSLFLSKLLTLDKENFHVFKTKNLYSGVRLRGQPPRLKNLDKNFQKKTFNPKLGYIAYLTQNIIKKL